MPRICVAFSKFMTEPTTTMPAFLLPQPQSMATNIKGEDSKMRKMVFKLFLLTCKTRKLISNQILANPPCCCPPTGLASIQNLNSILFTSQRLFHSAIHRKTYLKSDLMTFSTSDRTINCGSKSISSSICATRILFLTSVLHPVNNISLMRPLRSLRHERFVSESNK